MAIKHFVSFYFVILFSMFPTEGKRLISCNVYSSSFDETFLNVVHIKSVGHDDTLHYLWSSYMLPSIIIGKTTNDTELILDLQKLKSLSKNAVQFSKKPLSVIGFTISEVMELIYNSDIDGVTDMKSVDRLGLENFQWQNISANNISCSDDFAKVILTSSGHSEIFSKNGSFNIQFSTSSEEISASDYPHLLYTGNSSQIRLSLENFSSNNSRTRFGVELKMHSIPSASCSNRKCDITSTDSISDEFSPGIFSDIDVFPPCMLRPSFLTWRPVVYTSKEPSIANSSDATLTSECSDDFNLPLPHSIAELYFNDQQSSLTNAFNVTFGTVGDGFYPKMEYAAWSLMVGVGSPLHTKLSLTALIWICVGLGALLLFIVIGAIFFGYKMLSSKLKEDETSLLNTAVNS